jgi:GT2 family glycosyltransferase
MKRPTSTPSSASGSTAACPDIRRAVFEGAGGLSEELSGNCNDIDLSMKVTRPGYRILWIPHSALCHFESRSRERTVPSMGSRRDRSAVGVPDRERYVPNS